MKYWQVYLLILLVMFLVPEAYALLTKKIPPLTSFVRLTTKRYLVIIFLLGELTGWAMMHFWGQGWCG
jgi:hypothetical protein